MGRLCRCSCLSRGINACIFIFSAAGSCWMPSGWFSHPPGTPVTASAHTEICKTFFFWCQQYYSGKVKVLQWITSSPKCDPVSLTNTSSFAQKWSDGELKGSFPDLAYPAVNPSLHAHIIYCAFSPAPWRTNIICTLLPLDAALPTAEPLHLLLVLTLSLYASIFKNHFSVFSGFFPLQNMWLHLWKNNNVYKTYTDHKSH